MAEIVIENLRKVFGDFTAVQSSSFRIEDGEFFMLLGPSGCGKTTTLRMIAGLELPTSGEIYIDGEEVGQKPASQRDIAFVFQMFALYPHMNVRRNISYPLVSQGMKRAEVKARVAEVARILGIEEILDRAVGRRPAARGLGPGHRAQPQGLHDGRASGCAGCRVPRTHGRGAARAARPDGRHHRLCHP
jgi:multiple sugar transport system ATP-binding protein